jgi:hypothetical protein
VVQPVKPMPPHWAYAVAEQLAGPVDDGLAEVARVVDGDGAFVVLLLDVLVLVLGGGLGVLPPEGDDPPPLQVKSCGPGIV